MAFRSLSIGFALLVGSTITAPAADPIRLRVADSFPKGHSSSSSSSSPGWRTSGSAPTMRVTFEHYPAQQLGKAADMLKLTQTGVADIGYCRAGLLLRQDAGVRGRDAAGRLRAFLPGNAGLFEARQKGVIAEQDYAANGIRLLLAVSLPQYRIFTVTKPVKDVGDVTVLKLRSTGGAQDLTLRAIGAVPVRMAAPDAYESLQRGTMDGLLFRWRASWLTAPTSW